ncbi:MAG: hypothetical protein Q8S21_00845 [Candidatus Paracaedibacteraceae bacterium]|nr:hypothetical protein [Candidatus Paracaedibacteraceae bacterium]
MKNKYIINKNVSLLLAFTTCFAGYVFAKYDQKLDLLPLPTDEIMIKLADLPEKITPSATGADDKAKAKMNLADLKMRSAGLLCDLFASLSFPSSIKEAYDLYNEVAKDDRISADLRGRAKIQAAELYPYSNTDDSSYSSILQRRIESRSWFENVTEDSSCSIDLRGWAKIRLSRQYIANAFDVEPVDSRRLAQTLLEEVIADVAMSSDTKARARIQLANYYIKMRLNATVAESLEKAKAALNDVLKDPGAKADLADLRDLQAEAQLKLTEIKNNDADLYNSQKLADLKVLTTNQALPLSIRAKAKVIAARAALKGEFDSKPSESAALAINLYKDIVADVKLDAAERFAYKLEFAQQYAVNAFHQKTKEFNDAAQALYKELFADASASLQQKVIAKWQLALDYFEKRLNPPEKKDAKTAGLELLTDILSDAKLEQELWFMIKINYARLHHFSVSQNPLELSPSQAKSNAVEMLTEMSGDARLTRKQKELVQAEIELWNGRKE